MPDIGNAEELSAALKERNVRVVIDGGIKNESGVSDTGNYYPDGEQITRYAELIRLRRDRDYPNNDHTRPIYDFELRTIQTGRFQSIKAAITTAAERARFR